MLSTCTHAEPNCETDPFQMNAAIENDTSAEVSSGAGLAAGEYPISIDAILPTLPRSLGPNGEVDADLVAALRSAPSTVRHNSIHRHVLSTNTIARYCRLEQIGEGTYGQVYRAKCLTPTIAHPDGGEMVALKKIRLHHPGYWGIPPTVIREIKILKKLQHRNMVKMFEVASSKGVEGLDWEDEREDERRKKEKEGNNNNADTTPQLPPSGTQTGGGTTVDNSNNPLPSKGKSSAAADNTGKKKKKDDMSDLEKLRESYKGNLFLVLEYISHDLTGLLDMATKFTEVQTKSITKQLLEVLEFMHARNYVHRDLKSSNVLITDRYEVKLADFGLARSLDGDSMGRSIFSDHHRNPNGGGEGDFTNKVITLWYRPPELLLGETKYGTAVDIWSAGCILAEIILGRPMFTGKDDMGQLKLIFDLIGTPTEKTWEGFNDLKLLRTGEVVIDKPRRPKLREKYASKIQPASAMSLLEKMLELDPGKRFTASNALNHRYFLSEPVAPDDPRTLGRIDLGGGDGESSSGAAAGFHEFQTKKRRREAKAVAKAAEEDAKRAGEEVEKQKEAFDRAYRDYLTKGASIDAGKSNKRSREEEQRQQQSSSEAVEVLSKRRLEDANSMTNVSNAPPNMRGQRHSGGQELPPKDSFKPPPGSFRDMDVSKEGMENNFPEGRGGDGRSFNNFDRQAVDGRVFGNRPPPSMASQGGRQYEGRRPGGPPGHPGPQGPPGRYENNWGEQQTRGGGDRDDGWRGPPPQGMQNRQHHNEWGQPPMRGDIDKSRGGRPPGRPRN